MRLSPIGDIFIVDMKGITIQARDLLRSDPPWKVWRERVALATCDEGERVGEGEEVFNRVDRCDVMG